MLRKFSDLSKPKTVHEKSHSPALAFSHSPLKKKEGNWGKLTFAKTSGIITENTLVSYCPFFFFTVPSNSPRTLRKLAQSSFHLIYRVANSSYFLEMIQCI